MLKLPVDDILPELLRNLERFPCAVLQASPGTGKTTRVPPALLRAPFNGSTGEILVLEPRRLAAKFAARRVASELGQEIGGIVGYQFRFENVSSARTRLRFLTEGMLMRRLLRDPDLTGVSAVVLDEFHERHLHGDVALGYLRLLQKRARPELRIVVMSATLDTEAVSRFLGDCPVIRVDNPLFPVELEYLKSPPAKSLDLSVRDAVASALNWPGHVLVFLPGMADIRRAESALSALAQTRGFRIAPLHGELSREEQDLALEPSPRTKVILATNVAETSLTIDGVTTVIDSGLHRVASYSWWSGVPTLRTRPISRASAVQRAGRAGRTAPGRCIRLYTKGDFDSRAAFDTAEIQRADLTQTVLELATLGISDPNEFPWFEKPAVNSVEAASQLLFKLGAIRENQLTGIGRRMAEIPAHPRLSRMLLEAAKKGCLPDAVLLAALISEGGLSRLDATSELATAGRDSRLTRVSSQLSNSFPSELRKPSSPDREFRNLRISILTGFPDRVARKREGGELLLSSGGSARVDETALAASGVADLFVALEIQDRQDLKTPGKVRSLPSVESLVAIEPEWLFDLDPPGVEEQDEVIWDSERKRVTALSRLRYGQIILSESPAKAAGETGTRMLCKMALGLDLERIGELRLPDFVNAVGKVADAEAFESVLSRIELLHQHCPGMPAPGGPLLAETLIAMLQAKTSLTELQAMSWPDEVIQALELRQPGYSHELAKWMPTHFQLPNGRRTPIHYRLDQPPWIESRLQDFFGLKQGPSIAGSRIALTLHLLAPNQRAVQVTRDLPGFWERVYPEIRGELSRRYPRHAWPEDPRREA